MNSSSFFNYEAVHATASPPNPSLAKPMRPFLSDWGNRQWSKLLALTQTWRLRAGEVLIQAGDSDCSFYLITFGQLEVLSPPHTAIDAGRSRRIAIVESGSIVGEQSFLDGEPQPYTVQAINDAEVARISPEAYTIFAAREPELARMLVTEVGRMVSLKLREIERLSE